MKLLYETIGLESKDAPSKISIIVDQLYRF